MASVMDIVVPDGDGWIEIAVAFAAYFVLSFLWWGPLFGKQWAKQMGMDMGEGGSFKEMAKPMAYQAVASFLVAFVFWHVTNAFTVDLDTGMMANPSIGVALTGAFYTWLGFFLPVQLGRVAWENASWALFGINAGGYLLGLAGMGIVFALF